MKNIYLKILSILALLLLICFFAFYFGKKVSYRFYLDKTMKDIVGKDLAHVKQYSPYTRSIDLLGDNIMSMQFINKYPNPNYSNTVRWGNNLVRMVDTDTEVKKTDAVVIEPNNYIEVSYDNGISWQKLIHLNDYNFANCHAALVYRDDIYCIVYATKLYVFDKNGQSKKHILSKNSFPEEELAVYSKDDNKLVIIWNDHRAQIPLPNFSPPFFYGPELIIAGELNLDTLEFKEHVIGYDKYDLKDLYGKDFIENKK